jgi:hypothetical protein
MSLLMSDKVVQIDLESLRQCSRADRFLSGPLKSLQQQGLGMLLGQDEILVQIGNVPELPCQLQGKEFSHACGSKAPGRRRAHAIKDVRHTWFLLLEKRQLLWLWLLHAANLFFELPVQSQIQKGNWHTVDDFQLKGDDQGRERMTTLVA